MAIASAITVCSRVGLGYSQSVYSQVATGLGLSIAGRGYDFAASVAFGSTLLSDNIAVCGRLLVAGPGSLLTAVSLSQWTGPPMLLTRKRVIC